MGTNEIIQEAINLKPQEKYLIIESLILSLNVPDKDIEKIWIEESQKRLDEYKNGNLKLYLLKKYLTNDFKNIRDKIHTIRNLQINQTS